MGLLAAAVAVLALPAAASAGGSYGHGHSHQNYNPHKKFDFVFGAGTLSSPAGQPPNFFSYNAWSNADGSNADGFLILRALGSRPTQQVVGDVECLRVEGDDATMIYKFAPGTTGVAANQVGGFVYVRDGHITTPPGNDAQRNGRYNQAQYDTAIAAGCPDPDTMTGNPIRSGRIVVHDAT